jgi:hypothetical protein
MESRVRIRIGIKSLPSHNTANDTSHIELQIRINELLDPDPNPEGQK